MTKDNCTPRPWRLYAPDRPLKEFIDACIDKSPDHQNYEARIITNIDNANDPEYRILCILGNGPKADANARLIINAVNRDHVFGELVEALQDIKDILNKLMVMNPMESDIYKRCEESLSKASKLTAENAKESEYGA